MFTQASKFFVHKIIKVRAETDSTDVDEIDRALVPTNPQIDDEIQVMESFQVLDEKDVSTLIQISAKKHVNRIQCLLH